jgi:DNA gyrase subunit A
MHLEKATKFTKSANIEGAVMKIHPHGSSYGTIVNMAQRDRQSVLLINGKGNFGQATSRDLAYAASRYTEVKLSDVGIEMMKDLNKNLVDFVPSYDGKATVPEVLPVKFPVILTQASSGVAYGMASSIPSFNLKELVNGMIKFIREGKKLLLVPDFSTKGFIVNNREVFRKINLEGSGSVQLRGKVEVDGYNVMITEIPYSTTREAIIDKIVELSKDKFKNVAEVKDLTDLKGLKVRVRFKRGTDMNTEVEKLFQLTPLQSSYSTNLNVLINGSPKNMSVWEVIEEWLKWRKQTIQRGVQFDINKMEKDLHILKGLEKVLLDIDKAIEIIRHNEEKYIIQLLMDYFKIDELQANEVADMKLRYINREYIIKKIKDIDNLAHKIENYKDLVQNNERLDNIIIKDLEDVAEKYGVERQSKLLEVNSSRVKAVKKKMEEVPNYPTKLFITKEGYVKKMAIHANFEDQYVKPGDEIINEFSTWNKAELLVFGKDRCCHKIKVSEIEESTNKALGTFIPSLCDVDGIVGCSVFDESNKFIIIGYDNNKIAKINLKSFEGNRKKLQNSLADNASVVGILTFKDEGKFIFKTTTSTFKVPTSKFDLKERWTKGTYGPQKGKLIEIRMAD